MEEKERVSHQRGCKVHAAVAVLLLCLPGFFFNFQPSEPYLTVYLEEVKNISDTVLNTRVWPADTYASFAFLIPFGLLGEIAGILPTLIVALLFREATRALLVFGQGVTQMVIMQVTYAAGSAGNSAYFSLPYVFLEKTDKAFAVSTALQHCAYHVGNLCGSGLAQGLVSSGVVKDLTVLFYISWAFTSLAFAAVILLFFVQKQRDPRTSLWRQFREHGGRKICSLDLTTWAAVWGLTFGNAGWQLISNYFQQNLKEAGMGRTFFGALELSVEGVFVVSSIPAFLLRTRHHAAALIWSCITLALYSLGCFLDWALFDQLSWPFVFVLNLVVLGAFQVMVQICITIVAQRLEDRYVLVYSVASFLSLGFATCANEIGVAVGLERSAGYYLIAGVLGMIGVVGLAVFSGCVCWKRRRDGKKDEDEVLLLAEPIE